MGHSDDTGPVRQGPSEGESCAWPPWAAVSTGRSGALTQEPPVLGAALFTFPVVSVGPSVARPVFGCHRL